MNNDLFSIKGGLYFKANCRKYGNQDKGISPEGAQDQTAFLTAYHMLGKPTCFNCVEIIYPGKIVFNDNVLFVITGAPYEHVELVDNSKKLLNKVNHACVYQAGARTELILKNKEIGFRTVLMSVELSKENQHRTGMVRGEFHQFFPFWRELNKPIRIFAGPEYYILEDDTFLNSEWQLDKQSNQMGIRLIGNPVPHQKLQMISQPVNDGTIQLSPNGPIVLMRHRQTTGGYPRIACVADVDIDRLSQVPLGSRITFEIISFEEAVSLKNDYLEAFKLIESQFK